MKLENKVAVVTGAGGGIGSEIVLALLEKGAKVAAVDLRVESLEKLKEIAGENGKNISTHAVDITDKKSVEALPKEVIGKQGNVDIVINNAGIIQPFVKINELDFDTIDRVMNVNFYGTLYMTKAFLPHLLKRPEGYLANVSSMGGFLPVPGQSIYGASKAAVKLMTEGLYSELMDTNVHVSIIFPGATETNITANSGVEPPKVSGKKYQMLSAKEAARQIVSGMEKNTFQIYVGKDCNMMNTMCRFNPKFATELIAKQMKDLLAK